MVPFRLAKMKSADLPVPVTSNPDPLLATWPVGPWGEGGLVVGMATVRGTIAAVVNVTA